MNVAALDGEDSIPVEITELNERQIEVLIPTEPPTSRLMPMPMLMPRRKAGKVGKGKPAAKLLPGMKDRPSARPISRLSLRPPAATRSRRGRQK
jgi:hypothetical protein